MTDKPSAKPETAATASYRAFLLRLWREPGQTQADVSIWRFSLESTSYTERIGFASLEELVAFLRQQIDHV